MISHEDLVNEVAKLQKLVRYLLNGQIDFENIRARAIKAENIEADAITANEIAANAITANELAANSVTTPKVQAGAITADKITVSQLSAITADMGSLTAGTVTGALIRTAASGQRVELSSSDNLLRAVNSSGYTLRIEPDAGTSPGMVLSDGSKIGLLLFDGDTFYVAGQLGAGLQLVSNVNVDIYAAGSVNVYAPDGFYVNGNLVAP